MSLILGVFNGLRGFPRDFPLSRKILKVNLSRSFILFSSSKTRSFFFFFCNEIKITRSIKLTKQMSTSCSFYHHFIFISNWNIFSVDPSEENSLHRNITRIVLLLFPAHFLSDTIVFVFLFFLGVVFIRVRWQMLIFAKAKSIFTTVCAKILSFHRMPVILAIRFGFHVQGWEIGLTKKYRVSLSSRLAQGWSSEIAIALR